MSLNIHQQEQLFLWHLERAMSERVNEAPPQIIPVASNVFHRIPVASESNVTELGRKEVKWVLKDWTKSHQILAEGRASCTLTFEEPRLTLKFYLQPHEKVISAGNIQRYYQLCCETLGQNPCGVVNVRAKVNIPTDRMYPYIAADGQMDLRKCQNGLSGVVIEDFVPIQQYNLDNGTVNSGNGNLAGYAQQRQNLQTLQDLTIDLTVTLYQVRNQGDNVDAAPQEMQAPKSDEKVTLKSEDSMARDLRNMYAAEENYSDLRIETKDHMTLTAHKFQLSARSPVLRDLIKVAMEREDFDGTIKLSDVNAKPFMILLYWIYAGELHPSADKVMKEVLDAAINYKMYDLLKLLDEKIIGICTKENMFQLYQVAKEVPMPCAIKDISAFIKENL